eukprot:jgi/Botrbrau1/996/Bobra.114_1s0034.1
MSNVQQQQCTYVGIHVQMMDLNHPIIIDIFTRASSLWLQQVNLRCTNHGRTGPSLHAQTQCGHAIWRTQRPCMHIWFLIMNACACKIPFKFV